MLLHTCGNAKIAAVVRYYESVIELQIDPKSSSPVKSPTSASTPIRRAWVMFVLENALYLIMSQAVRYLREPAMSSRDKQLLKRELSAELVSIETCFSGHAAASEVIS